MIRKFDAKDCTIVMEPLISGPLSQMYSMWPSGSAMSLSMKAELLSTQLVSWPVMSSQINRWKTRSAISIARRLQDHWPEVVKIDAKSSVWVNTSTCQSEKIDGSLGFVVDTVVNQVGVNINIVPLS